MRLSGTSCPGGPDAAEYSRRRSASAMLWGCFRARLAAVWLLLFYSSRCLARAAGLRYASAKIGLTTSGGTLLNGRSHRSTNAIGLNVDLQVSPTQDVTAELEQQLASIFQTTYLYKFKFTYSDGSYYTGTVADNGLNLYAVDYRQGIAQQAGGFGTWLITGVAGTTTEAPGTIDIANYYNAANQRFYTPSTGGHGAGTAGFGSEQAQITAGGQSYAFGQGQSGAVETAPPAPTVAYTDALTGTPGGVDAEPYSGNVTGLQFQYVWSGSDPVAIRADRPNAFLKGGASRDALQATSGSNVLDGSDDSNFLVGSTAADGGADTFVLDALTGTPVWDTIVNFRPDDQVNLYGFQAGLSTRTETDSDGVAGYTGVTIHSELNGTGTGTLASLTFAGIDRATADAHFSYSTAMQTDGSRAGLEYLQIRYLS